MVGSFVPNQCSWRVTWPGTGSDRVISRLCSQMHKINLLEDKVMKKILLALILGLVFFPVTATAQKWIDPYMRKDGTFVEGHWESPKDSWQRSYSQPGAVNPLTGQFNTYGSRNYLAPPNPTLKSPNPLCHPRFQCPKPVCHPRFQSQTRTPSQVPVLNRTPYTFKGLMDLGAEDWRMKMASDFQRYPVAGGFFRHL